MASVLGLLVSTTLLVVVLGYAALVVLSAVQTGAPIVTPLVDLAVPFLPIVALLTVVATVTAVGTGWGIVRRVSMPESARLQSAFEDIERRNSTAEALGLSAVVAPPEPTPEERTEAALADLKGQYVAGEIDEATFERKLNRLVSDDSLDDARAAREREATSER